MGRSRFIAILGFGLGCTRLASTRMTPLSVTRAPDLVASIADCRSRDLPPPITRDSTVQPRSGFLIVRISSTADPTWKGETSVWLVGPLEAQTKSARVSAPFARAEITGVGAGRYVARFSAIAHYARVDTVVVLEGGAAINVPMVATPSHACGFDGYKVVHPASDQNQPNER